MTPLSRPTGARPLPGSTGIDPAALFFLPASFANGRARRALARAPRCRRQTMPSLPFKDWSRPDPQVNPTRDLNQARILFDHSYEPMTDYSTTSGTVECIFRELPQRLATEIRRYSHVCGCVAWLTEEKILRALASTSCSIVVQKEDFLRPDAVGKDRLQSLYRMLQCEPERPEFSGLLRDACVCTESSMQPVRCVGNHNSERHPAHPRMHNKFLVFCNWKYERERAAWDSESTESNLTDFDNDVDLSAGHGLEHVPNEVWQAVRNLCPSDDLAFDVLEFEDRRVCRNILKEALASEGSRRWLHIWERHRKAMIARFKRSGAVMSSRSCIDDSEECEASAINWDFRRLVPRAVWTGSFNPTHNGGQSLENAVLITDPQIAEAYLREFEQIALLSEELDWTSDWMNPQWRVGT